MYKYMDIFIEYEIYHDVFEIRLLVERTNI